ncbi:MAG TPA: alpha/beta hydrolase [Erwinia persicina]|uniref:Alpha/beta hydrolase n=2 Tax=Erwinia persicina TaxID=55211 RepID=A0A3S7S461_9GAMM|nr:alpha/beta fold hydrolase [Erwinia persicina]AXU95521.1 alpha/beta hydrolase [Erwinia persicina]MBC3945844.1 alpha/beta fold hydrolase [Erwinia persicina]MBD8166076.1 alpha/beta fold hydrolase [Erwinia persicina]MCQ4092715.1 alpha/beta fold hydrolase [Erwinia persicina]MCQ4100679.1 alpha/beta fold hydrolase [Erwinia persicina]
MTEQHGFVLHGTSRIGVLLIHGLTGTPNEMRGIARELNQAGHTVCAVQLAGHCGSADDLISTCWQDWYQSVIDAAKRLRQQVDCLIVGGLSMGALLALKYASDFPVNGVLVYSATFRYDGWSIPPVLRWIAPCLLPLAGLLHLGRHRMFNEKEPYGVCNETLRRRIAKSMQEGDSAVAGLPGNPWPSLTEMMALSRNVRRALPRVVAPCLVLHAENDDIAHRRNALLIRDSVSGEVELALLRNSYHMITIDNDRAELITRTLGFIKRQNGTQNIRRSAPLPLPTTVSTPA